MSETERGNIEYIDLTPEQIERFREYIPELEDKAFLMVNRLTGWYLVAWEDGDIRYQYDPSRHARRHMNTKTDNLWSSDNPWSSWYR